MSQLPPGWIQKKDASGQPIYFNMQTQESTYQIPRQGGNQPQNVGNPFYDDYNQGYKPPNQYGGYQELEGDISLNREQQNQQNQQKFGFQVSVQQNQQPQQQGKEDKPSGWRMWCSIQIFNEYFQVNTKDIQERLKYSLFFWTNQFQQITQSNPDIYGPFWIFTTLIFILSVMGNLSRYFSNIENDPGYVLKAASLFYIVGFSVPITLCLILKLFGSQMKVGHYICIYGYSFTVFIPVCFLEAIPNVMLQVFILMIGGGIQIFFLIRNFESELENYIQSKKWVGIGILVTIQVFLLFAFKTYFSDEVFVEEKPHIEQL